MRFFSLISQYLLPSLVVVFGMQFLRTLIPSLVWYLRDAVGLATMQLVPYAFGTFFLGFLAAIIRRLFGARGSIWLTAGGVALLRVIEQFSADPQIDLWLSIAGLGLFLNFLSIFIGHVRAQGEWAAPRWVYGLILGMALDTALRGAFGGLDLNTIEGLLPSLTIVVLAILLLILVWREPMLGGSAYEGSVFLRALPLLAIGTFFVLQTLFFGSEGYIEQVSGWSAPLGFILVMVGYALAALGVTWGYIRPRALHPLLALGIAIYLGYAIFGVDGAGSWIILTTTLGQFILGWTLAMIAQLNAKGETRGLGVTTLMVAGGMLLFLVLVFGFYVAQDMALPVSRHVFPAVAGVLAGILALVASLQMRKVAFTETRDMAGVVIVSALIIVPILYGLGVDRRFSPKQPSGEPVKIMAYNIHSGFNAIGLQDLEGIAQVIEQSGADVVALQEVSRVRLMDGGADMPEWLSIRLGMPYVFQGTEEPHWGNAILSRYPILETGWGDLPRAGKLIGRGYLWVRVDTGGPVPLLVIDTHLHHLGPDSDARVEQVPPLLAFWNDQPAAIILGDLNAEPGSPEMDMLAAAGLVDAWSLAGQGDGYTYSSLQPVKRIDWIWHSPDLTPVDIEVIQTTASDHMPVLATFEFAP
jgi:endonuclease/exonuclease/phosphatase family metal-dependent hydrolase